MISKTENIKREFKIKNKNLSGDEFYFITEIGHNHQGSVDQAFKLIKQAKEAGSILKIHRTLFLDFFLSGGAGCLPRSVSW